MAQERKVTQQPRPPVQGGAFCVSARSDAVPMMHAIRYTHNNKNKMVRMHAFFPITSCNIQNSGNFKIACNYYIVKLHKTPSLHRNIKVRKVYIVSLLPRNRTFKLKHVMRQE